MEDSKPHRNGFELFDAYTSELNLSTEFRVTLHTVEPWILDWE